MLKLMVSLLAGTAACVSQAGPCDGARTNEQVVKCVAADLRQADDGINASYGRLMATLGEPARTDLRLAQRQWIRERNALCNAYSKEPDRDKWFEAMLQDFPRAVCVTRLTYRRDEELRAMLSGGATAAPNPAPVPAAPAEAGAHRTAPGNDASAEPQRAYDGKRATPHFKGKWYYELRVDYARALAIEPTLVIAGAMADGQMTGSMLAVRSGDANRSPDVMGVAIDLDEGKLYTSMNGDWGANIPGSNHGATSVTLNPSFLAPSGPPSGAMRPPMRSAGTSLPILRESSARSV